jgi:glutathione peroxidase
MSGIVGKILIWAMTALVGVLGLQSNMRPEPKTAPSEPAVVVPLSQSKATSLFEFTVNTINGEAQPLSKYRGNVVLVVNTASRCGLTPQYAQLEKLYRENRDKGFVVIGFPSNSFRQELPTNQAVAEFCEVNFGVTFPLMEITEVRGKEISPVYRFLSQNLRGSPEPDWNFAKFLVDRDGQPVRFFSARISPESGDVQSAIREELQRRAQ